MKLILKKSGRKLMRKLGRFWMLIRHVPGGIVNRARLGIEFNDVVKTGKGSVKNPLKTRIQPEFDTYA